MVEMKMKTKQERKEYRKDKINTFSTRVKLIMLTPIKLIYMIAQTLKSSQIGEMIFVILGLAATIMLGLYFILPFNARWKYVAFFAYITIMIAFEIMFLISVWNKFHSFICRITRNGNVEYNKCRDRLREKVKNYSMGLDEEAKEPIDYFIKKMKPEKPIVFIHK